MADNTPKALENPGTFAKDTAATKKARKDRLKSPAPQSSQKRAAKKTNPPAPQPPAGSEPKAEGET